jgi:hypothetical protein
LRRWLSATRLHEIATLVCVTVRQSKVNLPFPACERGSHRHIPPRPRRAAACSRIAAIHPFPSFQIFLKGKEGPGGVFSELGLPSSLADGHLETRSGRRVQVSKKVRTD